MRSHMFDLRRFFSFNLQKHTVRRRGDQCTAALSTLPLGAEFTLGIANEANEGHGGGFRS